MFNTLRSALLVLTAAIASTSLAQNNNTHLKIGVVIPLSGAQASYGQHSLQAIELAYEKLKAKDPELAKRISLIKEDDKSNPIDATTATKKLLNVDKVDLIFGSISSSNTLAMIASVMEARKPLVTFASTNPAVTQKGDLVFRTCFADPFQGKMVAQYALKNLQTKKAAILFDHKSDYSTGLKDSFTKTFTAEGGQIVATEAYESGKKDFKIQLTKIKSKQPEVLFIPGYFQEVGLVMKQAHQIGLKVIMLGADGWDNANLYEIAGPEAAQGHYYASHFSTDDKDPEVQAFVKTYTDRYKSSPVSMAAAAYDGLLLVADAFKRANSNDTEKLRKALSETRNFKGVAGTLTINAQRDAEKEILILKTEGNKAVFATKLAP